MMLIRRLLTFMKRYEGKGGGEGRQGDRETGRRGEQELNKSVKISMISRGKKL